MKTTCNGKVSKSTQESIGEYFAKYGKTRKHKKAISSLFNQGMPEPRYGSLMEYTRICSEDEAYTEYGILDPKDFNGGMDELVEWLEDQKQFNASPYDCTGQFYTAYQLVHVNPTGLVSFVHHLVLDV